MEMANDRGIKEEYGCTGSHERHFQSMKNSHWRRMLAKFLACLTIREITGAGRIWSICDLLSTQLLPIPGCRLFVYPRWNDRRT